MNRRHEIDHAVLHVDQRRVEVFARAGFRGGGVVHAAPRHEQFLSGAQAAGQVCGRRAKAHFVSFPGMICE